jgi:hypothetical protein
MHLQRSELMPYTHPMPVVCFTSGVIGENLFVFTAGGEGLIRAWQFDKAANSFAHVSVFEGHTRGVTALLFTGASALQCCAVLRSGVVWCIVATPSRGCQTELYNYKNEILPNI